MKRFGSGVNRTVKKLLEATKMMRRCSQAYGVEEDILGLFILDLSVSLVSLVSSKGHNLLLPP